MSTVVLLLLLLCLTSQARASEEYWEGKYDEQINCAREKEMRELGPGRCVSTGTKHRSRPPHVHWADCKTLLATKLLRKCRPGSVGQEGSNAIEWQIWVKLFPSGGRVALLLRHQGRQSWVLFCWWEMSARTDSRATEEIQGGEDSPHLGLHCTDKRQQRERWPLTYLPVVQW